MKIAAWIIVMIASVCAIFSSERYTATTKVLFKYEKYIRGSVYPHLTLQEGREVYDERVHPMTYANLKIGDTYSYVKTRHNDFLIGSGIVGLFIGFIGFCFSTEDSTYIPAKYS
jgi:hypothetical protein